MAYFNLSAFTCSGIMVMMVSLFFSVESKENYNETELNLPKVLNTSLPLYLYYTCSNIFVQNECTKNICIVETYTCINMRKNMLTNYTYNFTLSTRKNVSMWDNTTYFAEFVNKTPPSPPSEMMYNTTTEGRMPYTIDMNLTFNEPDFYNCSVFNVTYTFNGLHLVPMETSMYIRGQLPNNTQPSEDCISHFLTYCRNRTIYKPYNSNCTLNETIC
nr:uncharacterized protein LOC119165660 isoform X1 [Rhipicephalus microplus]